MEVNMRIEKKTLNDALRVLGKVVSQTSPVELYRSIRFVGGHGVVRAMATDGVEVVTVVDNQRSVLVFDGINIHLGSLSILGGKKLWHFP
jgi:hypothetical protein